MLKGKSKIQLFNASTGALEHEEKNDNVVTCAVEDIINDNDPLGLGKLATVYSTFYSNRLQRRRFMEPLAQTAFGGVLLWDNTIDEDPATTMPPDGVNEVGHAGNAYSGNNSFRGTYNANESGEIENGYRHVWDFGTDRANGEIKALSLTSQYGGMCGYRNDSNWNGECYPPYSYYQFGADTAYQVFNTNADYIDYDAVDGCDNGPFLYIDRNPDGSFWGLKRSITNYTKIQKVTFANTGVMTLDGIGGITGVSDLITGINQYALVYVYEGKIHEVYINTTTQLIHKTYSFEGAELNTVMVNLPEAVQSFALSSMTDYQRNGIAFYYSGVYYYWHSQTNVNTKTYRKCNADGDDLGEAFTIPVYSGNNVYYAGFFFVDKNGVGVLRISNGRGNATTASASGADVYIHPDGKVYNSSAASLAHTVNSPAHYPALASFNKSPFVYLSCGTNAARFLLAVDCRYLATINNLTTPVTKTKAQTMKITYEITEVEDDG